jgi:TPR repeat protein
MTRWNAIGLGGVLGLALSALSACADRPPSSTVVFTPTGSSPATTTGSAPPGAALDLAQKCQNERNANACTRAGVEYEHAGDFRHALEQYDRGCALGNSRACVGAGVLNIDGRLPRDASAAGRDFGKACDFGLAKACAGAAHFESDPQKRRGYAQRGCDGHELESCADLGRMMMESGSEAANGRVLLERSCANTADPAGAATACAALANAYELGVGGAPDQKKAIELYEKACALNAQTCSMLGDAYLRGAGVEKSKAKAKELYSKACSAGAQDGCDAAQSVDKDQSFGGMRAVPVDE